jgi:hypothetical protein
LQQTAVIRPNAPFQIARLKAAGVPCETSAFSPWYPWTTWHTLRRVTRTFRPDIIQYWSGRAAMNAPKWKAHNIGWYGGYRERWRFKTCTYFIGITPDLVEHIHKQGVPRENIALIHTLADYTPQPPINRAVFDTPKNAPLLLALARMPGASLWIAGEGEDRAKLEAQTRRLGVEDRAISWLAQRPRSFARCCRHLRTPVAL